LKLWDGSGLIRTFYAKAVGKSTRDGMGNWGTGEEGKRRRGEEEKRGKG
jgi:hypothetical protein